MSDSLKKMEPDVMHNAMPAPKWLGKHPILDERHAYDLEQAAAIGEFHRKQPRDQAEAAAYDEYKKTHHSAAAAHHFAGIRAAQGAGDMEEARRHGDLFAQHMRALGEDPYGPVPDHIRLQAEDPKHTKVYRFANHGADQFLGQHLSKSELGESEMENTGAPMEKVAPPGFSEETMHELKRKHGVEGAFKIAWAAYEKGQHKKSEDGLKKGQTPVQPGSNPLPTTWRGLRDHRDPVHPNESQRGQPMTPTYDPPIGRALDHDGPIYQQCTRCKEWDVPTRALPNDGRLSFGGRRCQNCDAAFVRRMEADAARHGQDSLKYHLKQNPQAAVPSGFANSGVAKSELLRLAKAALALGLANDLRKKE